MGREMVHLMAQSFTIVGETVDYLFNKSEMTHIM